MARLTPATDIPIIVFSLAIAAAEEKKVQQSDLPASVQKTIEERSRGPLIKSYSTEMEHGKRVYEAETVVNGHTRDLQIASDGTLNEIEEEVTFNSLPSPVQAWLLKKSAGAKISKVETVTRHGKLVVYEASTVRDAKEGEIQVGPNGESLKI
jgi:hypothetical protein